MEQVGVATGLPSVGDAHSEAPVEQDLADHYSPPKELHVLGEFTVSEGSRTIDIAPACQRVVTMLALSDKGTSRATLAGTIWPNKSQSRAAANLRCALWRLPEEIRATLDGNGVRLSLDSHWSVDIVMARRIAAELRSSYNHDPKLVDHFRSDLLRAGLRSGSWLNESDSTSSGSTLWSCWQTAS
jgi:hypothetical protein